MRKFLLGLCTLLSCAFAPLLCGAFCGVQLHAASFTSFLKAERGFYEVTTDEDIVPSPDYCYLLASAENSSLIVGVGRYEAKPGWAPESTKALRYKAVNSDPVLDLSNFFTIERSGQYIGLRNVVYNTSFFQTHDNAGYMYVLTYTEPTLTDWCYLTPIRENGYWLFESGKYPVASDNWACGYLGPWNKRVAEGQPIALNRRNVSGDKAGHYRLFRIAWADLLTIRNVQLCSSPPTVLNVKGFIVNPSFETGDETGWTIMGKDPEGNEEFKVCGYAMTNRQGNYLMNAFQWWAPTLSVSQTVTNLPAGQYELSAVMATWEGRTATLSGNGQSVVLDGQGDGTGIRVKTDATVGNNGQLVITAESSARWFEEGHEDELQTFFKLDDVQLKCKGVYLDGMAICLPNDLKVALVPGQWYYFDSQLFTDYQCVGVLDDIVYSSDGDKFLADITTAPLQSSMTIPVGRIYFKTDEPEVRLAVRPLRNIDGGTFTAVALNVDGLPNKMANRTLNEDGPGSDGTKKISQYLAAKNYDLIGCSEDFNYHGSLISSLQDNYSWGTVRATLSVDDLPWSQIIQGKFRFDTDGLNLLWKNATFYADNESWTQWNSLAETEGNQYVRKGFRHYDLHLHGNHVIDVYVLHMDAGDTDAIWSRHEQWKQLAEAVNGSDHNRAKLIIGDTNSRWTREEIGDCFFRLIGNDLVVNDVYVELVRNGIYPTTDMNDLVDGSDPENYWNYEVVDKIFYINPTAPNTMRLMPQEFRIEQDYTYDTIDHNGNTQPLGDHRPVVVTFSYLSAGDILPTGIDDSVVGGFAADGSVSGGAGWHGACPYIDGSHAADWFDVSGRRLSTKNTGTSPAVKRGLYILRSFSEGRQDTRVRKLIVR